MIDLSVGVTTATVPVVMPRLHTTGDTADAVVSVDWQTGQRWARIATEWATMQAEVRAAVEGAAPGSGGTVAP